jgi:hypothetical protein
MDQDRIVDEFVFRRTHTVRVDWLLPGVAPTGRRLELVTPLQGTADAAGHAFAAAALDHLAQGEPGR